jgi:alkylation response protein AidB-like acyl-CoA dehydrogenase
LVDVVGPQGTVTPSTWQRLCPLGVLRDPVLEQIERTLWEPDTLALLDQLEADESYPGPVLDRLRSIGLMSLFAGEDAAAGRPITLWHLAALNVLSAQVSGSLAITLGVNGLALLPVYIAADEAQRRKILAEVRAGAFSSLLLTELAHGSNLARNEAFAERGTLDEAGVFLPGDRVPATHYRIRGEKQLINGGTHHEVLVVLLRTREATPQTEADLGGASNHFTVFRVPRGPGVEAMPRWQTLPAHAADISGVRFTEVIVAAENLIGGEGNGFSLVQQALSISRGGVSALAAGAASSARAMAVSYARERNIHGKPIVHLDSIADHLLRTEALDLLASALSLKAVATSNCFGPAAVHYGCVAKFACSAFAEEAVTEGRRVLGARALLREFPYERLVRDVTLYGVFDGTSHIVLDQIQWRLAQSAQREGGGEDTLELARRLYQTPPQPLVEIGRRRARPFLLPIDLHALALAGLGGAISLAPLAKLARALLVFTRSARESGRWDTDQGIRFAAAELFAHVEALIASAELADPHCRQALGLPAVSGHSMAAVHRFALSWFGARTAAALRQLWVRVELPGAEPLVALERDFLRDFEAARAARRKALRETERE